MIHTVYIDTDTEVARKATAGTELPSVALKLRTDQTLAFAFMSGGTVGPVTGWNSGKCTLRENPTTDVLLLDLLLDVTGATTATRYNAAWTATTLDGPTDGALRTFMAGAVEPKVCWCEITWIDAAGTHAVSFPMLLIPSFSDVDDEAPPPNTSSSWAWLKARLAAGDNITFTVDETAKTITISAAGGGSVTWDSIPDKPSTFAPATHTHNISDVTGLQGALDAKATSGALATEVTARANADTANAAAITAEATARATADATLQGNINAKASSSLIGANNGIAPLDNAGKVPAVNLPSYVDDVIEAANFAALPGTGETGKIYVVLDSNKVYRWSGSAYVEISGMPAFASQAEAENGSDNTKLMTPLRTAQAITLEALTRIESDNALQANIDQKANSSWIGANDGIAPLGSDGKVPNVNLPSLGGGGVVTPNHCYVDLTNGDDLTGAIADPAKPYQTLEVAYAAHSTASFILLPCDVATELYSISLQSGQALRYKSLIPFTTKLKAYHNGGDGSAPIELFDEGVATTPLLLQTVGTNVAADFTLTDPYLIGATVNGVSGQDGTNGDSGTPGNTGGDEMAGESGGPGGNGGNATPGVAGGTIKTIGGFATGSINSSGGNGGNGGSGGNGGAGGNGGSSEFGNFLAGGPGGNGGNGGDAGAGGTAGNFLALSTRCIGLTLNLSPGVAGNSGPGGGGGGGGSGQYGGTPGGDGPPGGAGNGSANGDACSVNCDDTLIKDSTLADNGVFTARGCRVFNLTTNGMVPVWIGTQLDGTFIVS